MKVSITANITEREREKEREGKVDSLFTTLCRDEGDIRLKNDRNVGGCHVTWHRCENRAI